MRKYPPELITLAISQRLPARRLEPDDHIVQRKDIGIELHVEGDPVEIGRMEVVVLDFNTLSNERASLLDACDAHSKPILDLVNTILDEDERPNEETYQATKLEIIGTGLAYVDTLFVQPEYRGSQLGLAALHAYIRYGTLGCDAVFLKAYPLVREGEPRLSGGELDKARAKLRDLYASVGFKQIGDTDYMGLNLEYIVPAFPG